VPAWDGVPFTFLAHQAPIMPIAGRRSNRWDGVALVVGSMAPDLAYISSGWRYGPWGIPLYFDGHKLQNQILLAAFSCILVEIVRRLVLPIAPLVVAGRRGAPLAALGEVHHRWWVTYLSALFGALTHLFLDAFTHLHGSVVQAVPVLRQRLFTFAGHQVAPYHFLQYGGSVLLGAVCVVMVVRWWPTLPRPETVVVPGRRARAAVIAGFCAGLVLGVPYGFGRTGAQRYGTITLVLSRSVGFISFCWIAFCGLALGCAVARLWWDPRPAHQPRSIHS
jgi:hypothetical protein